MYTDAQTKQRYHDRLGGASQIEPQAPTPYSSPLDGAITRCDSSSQEVSALITALEERLDRVMAPPTPTNATSGGVSPDSGVPLIRALDELNHRHAMAAQRLRGLIERLAV